MRSGPGGKGRVPAAAARATPPPPWSPFARRRDAAREYWRGLRSHAKTALALDELRLLRLPRRGYFDWQTMPLRQLAVYKPDQVRDMIRTDSTLDRVEPRKPDELPALPALPALPEWRAVRGLANDPDGPWQLPDLIWTWPQPRTPQPPPAPPPPAQPDSDPHTARALSSVAVFLSVLLVMFRFGKRLSMRGRRRRPSYEWPLPDVIATRRTHGVEDNTAPMEPSVRFLAANQEALGMDQPPSYFECAGQAREAPPPPYSSCYVSFPDTEDRVPSVHFYNNPRPMYSVRVESGHSSAGSSAGDSGRHMAAADRRGDTAGCDHLMFNNGRVIQRMTNGENENNAAGNTGSGRGGGNNIIGSVRGAELAAGGVGGVGGVGGAGGVGGERAAPPPPADERLMRFISA